MTNTSLIRVKDIYKAALSILDEEDSKLLRDRTPAIVNTLIGRCYPMSETFDGESRSMWKPVCDLDDTVEGIDRTLCLSAMPYGLGAILVLDYDAVKSKSLWSVFQEMLERFRNAPGQFAAIEDVYGGIEKGEAARW